MNDCELRKAGEDFCGECPHRPVFGECRRRDGVIPLSSMAPVPSGIQRAGVFLLSAMALMTLPVALRTLFRLRVEGDVSHIIASIIGFFLSISMAVVLSAALYGLYASIWGGKRRRVA